MRSVSSDCFKRGVGTCVHQLIHTADCPLEELVIRVLARLACGSCATVLHTNLNACALHKSLHGCMLLCLTDRFTPNSHPSSQLAVCGHSYVLILYHGSQIHKLEGLLSSPNTHIQIIII